MKNIAAHPRSPFLAMLLSPADGGRDSAGEFTAASPAVALVDQIRAVMKERLSRPMGELTADDLRLGKHSGWSWNFWWNVKWRSV